MVSIVCMAMPTALGKTLNLFCRFTHVSRQARHRTQCDLIDRLSAFRQSAFVYEHPRHGLSHVTHNYNPVMGSVGGEHSWKSPGVSHTL